MKKRMNKVIPAAVAGLVLAGAGTLEANAAELTIPVPAEEGVETSERKETAAAPSTDIQTVGEPATQPNGDVVVPVNPDSYDSEDNTVKPSDTVTIQKDEDGNPVDVSGIITTPEVPAGFEEGEKEKIEGEITGALDDLNAPKEETGDKDETEDKEETGETVTAPTETTDETAAEDETKTEIGETKTETGSIDETTTTPEEKVPMDPGEEKDVTDDVEDAVEDEDGGFNWDLENLPGYDSVTHETQEDEEGNTLHVYTLTKDTVADAPLNADELNKLLGVTLTPTDSDNVYTYVNADGVTVTLTVDDNSTETTHTKWVITLKETKVPGGGEEVNGSEEISKPEQPPVVDIQPEVPDPSMDASVKDALDHLKDFQDENGNWDPTKVTDNRKDDVGTVTVVDVDGKKYEFTYSEVTNVDLGMLTNEQILGLLPSDGGYSLEAGKFYKEVDGVKYELTINDLESTLSKKQITISMKVTEKGTSDIPPVDPTEDEIKEAQDTADQNAMKEAIINAVQEAIKGQTGKGTLTDDEISAIKKAVDGQVSEGNVTVTVIVDGTPYTYTVNVKLGDPTVVPPATPDPDPVLPAENEGETQEPETKPDAPSQKVDSSASASITVEGGETMTEEIEEQPVKVDATLQGELDGLLNGATFKGGMVTDFEMDEAGNVTKVVTTFTDPDTKKTTVKTYNFTYEKKTTTSDAEKFGDGKKEAHWTEDETAYNGGYYHFNLNGANAFVVKQSGGAVIWCSDPTKTEAELKSMFQAIDGSIKNMNLHYLIGDKATNSFNLINIFGSGSDPNYDTKVEVRDGILYVYGEEKLSHVNIGAGSITEYTLNNGKWNGTTSWTESTEYKGQGTGSAIAYGKPGTSGTEDKITEGSASQSWYEGILSYTYTTDSTRIDLESAEKYVSSERDVNANLTHETPDPKPPVTPDPTPDPEPTPDPDPTPDPIPDPTPDPEPEAPVELPDEPTPLAETPVEEPAVQIDDEPAPLAETPETPEAPVELPDEPVPLAEIPEEDDPLVNLPDMDVPLADVPHTGDISGLWHLSALLSACGLGFLFRKERKERDRA